VLHHQLAALPWREVPVADHTRDRGHGRVELRRLQVATVAGLDVEATGLGPASARSPTEP